MKVRIKYFLPLLFMLCLLALGCSSLRVTNYQLYIKSDRDYLPVTNYMVPGCKEIYCLVDYKGATPNTNLKARWFYLEGGSQLLCEIPYLIKQPAGNICFYLKSESDFRPGKYSLELLKGQKNIWRKNFIINSVPEINFKILDYTFTSKVNDKIYPVNRVRNYLSGTKHFCFWFHYQNGSGEQRITGKWYLETAEGNLLIEETEMMTEEKGGYGELTVRREQQFLTGEYRLDIYLDGQIYNSYFFTVR